MPTAGHYPLPSAPERGRRRLGRQWRSVLVLLLLVAVTTAGPSYGPAWASQARDYEAERADKATPTVSLTFKTQRVSTKKRARVKVVVLPGASQSAEVHSAQLQSLRSGRVKVVVRGGATHRTLVAELVDHRAKAKLPKLAAGVYRVRASFPGNKLLGKARSRATRLTVVSPDDGGSSGFPDASNTGVPRGVDLTTYNRSCTITRADAVIDATLFNCPELRIQAAGVVIKRSRINGFVNVDTDVGRTWSVTLKDVEVNAVNAKDRAAIANGNVTIIRANIHGGHNGLECQEHSSHCVIRDSWIHDQWQTPTGSTHLGGMLVLGTQVPCNGTGGACVEIVHNTIVCDAPVNVDGGGCTGDINLLPHWGPLPGAIVTNNFLGANTGASFCTYGGAEMEYPATNVVYEDNVFERGPNNQCAAFGPVTSFDRSAAGNRWVNNRYEGGALVRPPH